MTESNVTIQSVLKTALVTTHRIVEGTLADVDDELANRPGLGLCHSIAGVVAHLVFAEDNQISRSGLDRAPLFASSWAGRTGVSLAPLQRGRPESEVVEWYRSVRIDVTANRAYRQAVFAQAEEFAESADAATLARTVDSPVGPVSVADLLATVVTGHINNHIGEVSAIKGALGRKGYPF